MQIVDRQAENPELEAAWLREVRKKLTRCWRNGKLSWFIMFIAQKTQVDGRDIVDIISMVNVFVGCLWSILLDMYYIYMWNWAGIWWLPKYQLSSYAHSRSLRSSNWLDLVGLEFLPPNLIWLVVWNMFFQILGISWSQLTNSYFSEG